MSTGFYSTSFGDEIIKDPNETLSYGIAWTDRLSTGVIVSSVSWEVPAGLTAGASSINSTAVTHKGRTHAIGTVTSVILSGGTLNTRYTVTGRATCSNAEIMDESFIVLMRSK